jgi:tRNA-2-methylthio-N6-dimethylallyladenosine synthase
MIKFNWDTVRKDQKEALCETLVISTEEPTGNERKLYIESYGCQMNFSDSEIVTSIMKKESFDTTSQFETADVIFINTCSIREKAEQTIRKRLKQFNGIKKQKPEMILGS